MIVCSTVGELRAALDGLPADAPLMVLYDWGADGKQQVVVHGISPLPACDPDADIAPGVAVLDIDPRPRCDQ